MDPLSEILTLLKPQAYLSACLDAGGAWSIRSENQIGAIKCYAITKGACWLRVAGLDDDIRVASGDCFVLPSGRSFTLASDLSLTPTRAIDVFGPAAPGSIITHNGGGDLMLIGTRFEVDARKAEMLLSVLPPLVLLKAEDDQAALRWSIGRMLAEMQENGPGVSLAAHHLAHLMLLQAFRLHLSRDGGRGVGWFYALADPQVGKAIEMIHADPGHRWTLDELAAGAGLSRSLFAKRFRERMGDTPIAYLTRWRMLLATARLSEGRDGLLKIALSLGYDSESAFNTAFKRVMGSSPRRYGRTKVIQVEHPIPGRFSR